MQSCKLNRETCASGASWRCPRAPGEGLLCVHHFIQSAGQEGEFCFIRARERSSSFLLFKVRKEMAMEMGVRKCREATADSCTFSSASRAPSRESHQLVIKTRKTPFSCLLFSCWLRASPSKSSFGSTSVYDLQQSHLLDSLQGWDRAVNVHALCLGSVILHIWVGLNKAREGGASITNGMSLKSSVENLYTCFLW